MSGKVGNLMIDKFVNAYSITLVSFHTTDKKRNQNRMVNMSVCMHKMDKRFSTGPLETILNVFMYV